MRRLWFSYVCLCLLVAALQAQEDIPLPAPQSESPVRLIAFDVFGTVHDHMQVPYEERKAYVDQLRRPEWAPLRLPASWAQMPPHPDSAEGIRKLREKGYLVITCSNGPLGLQARMAKNAGISWDAILPLEMEKVYKPDPRAYGLILRVFDVRPEEVLFVTANERAGDLEASRAAGMSAVLIRSEAGPRTIVELADSLPPVPRE